MNYDTRDSIRQPAGLLSAKSACRAGFCFAWVLAVGLGLLADSASGQTEWNRKMLSVAVIDGAAGPTVHAFGMAQVSAATADLDLSLEMELQINGLLVDSKSFDIVVNGGSGGVCQAGPPCSGSCGTARVNRTDVTLRCFKDCVGAACDCKCSLWISAEFDPTIPVSTGDEIMVILRPAPGALPEQDTSDDLCRVGYIGEEVYWNRGIESVELVPSPGGGPDTYDVVVEGYVGVHGAPGPNLILDLVAELSVNGSVLAVQTGVFQSQPPYGGPDDYGYCELSGCIPTCGYMNGLPASCGGGGGCACGSTLHNFFFPSVHVDPSNDEIMVILRPAPGALPELPGFEEDDEREPEVPASTEDDNATTTLARLGSPSPNPMVGQQDLDISFQLASAGEVAIEVYNTAGARVRTIVNQFLPAGVWSRTWDGRNQSGEAVASGMYYVRMRAGDERRSANLVLLR